MAGHLPDLFYRLTIMLSSMPISRSAKCLISSPLVFFTFRCGWPAATVGKRVSGILSSPKTIWAFGLASLFSAPAWADLSDTLHPFLSTAIAHSDNLLLLPDGLSAQPIQSDTYKTVTGGVDFERPISRQYLTGHLNFSKVTYNQFSQLDYSGKDLAAALRWEIGNRLSGNLSSSYVESLSPFDDSHSSERNVRTIRVNQFSGNWRFHPSWQVHVGYKDGKFSYELPQQRGNDRTETTEDAGVDYLAASGSSIGLLVRRWTPKYDNDSTRSALQSLDSLNANIKWKASGTTQLTFLGGIINRTHPELATNNGSSYSGRLMIDWGPPGKVKYNAAAWRETSIREGNVFGSSLDNGVSLGATWLATAKITANAGIQYVKRRFGDPAITVTEGELSDASASSNIGISYAPVRKVQLTLSGSHVNRRGSAAVFSSDYNVNSLALNAQVQF